MQISEPDVVVETVLDYDFVIPGHSRPLGISVWPDSGDTVIEDADRFTFHLPRLDTILTVWIMPGMTMTFRRSKRMKISPGEALQFMKKKIKDAEAEKART